MDDESIQLIVAEIGPLIVGRAPGKIFQLGPASLAIDFGLRHDGFLFICVEPVEPRLYLIRRRVRDLEKLSVPLKQFALAFRKELANTKSISMEKDSRDRIVRLRFAGQDELGNPKSRQLLAQLTGRSANLFLLNADNAIIQRARPTTIAGQQIGQAYQKPAGIGERPAKSPDSALLRQIRSHEHSSPSAAADAYFSSLLAEKEFAARLAAAGAELRKKISQQRKLLKQLEADLQGHATAGEQKRIGDLLLANLSTARRNGNRVTLIDYFADDAPLIEVEFDESASLQEEAARRFAAYSRSKRAISQITTRIDAVKEQLRQLESQQELSVPPALAGGPLSEPRANRGPGAGSPRGVVVASGLPAARTAKTTVKKIPGTRRYLSADGFEILVGRTSRDNDHLTFKVAKPNDLWLHAADYGGSHVVVRNSTRKAIPYRTLIEAAQLAAWFSQAKKDPKVDVHYAERKFVSKPKGAKPGLARIQRFKNITVAPKESGTRV